MQYEYSYSNQRRDLTDVLSTVISEQPRFISLFGTAEDAKQRKHEWLQDQIAPRSITLSNVATLTCTAGVSDVAKLLVGTTLNVKDDTALFRVTSKTNTTTFVIELAAANGSDTTAPGNTDVMSIVNSPIKEGSNNGDGEQQYRESDVAYNQTQILRKEVILTRTSMGIDTYGLENSLANQSAFAMQQVARDLNKSALIGARVAGSSGVLGEAGGLYTFATALSVDADTSTFDNFIVNDAAQDIIDEGGMPSVILCGPGQARVLSAVNNDKIRIIREDKKRGSYVASITNDMTGGEQIIIADYDISDTQAWVVDPAGFAISYLNTGHITDEDTTTKGFDGVQRTILGELTFEFKNANQRCCKIENLTASATALAAIRTAS